MSVKVVLFDLDGTLLPMDQETFIKEYLGGLVQKLVPHGYNPDLVVKAVYAGMKAMTTNDGSCTNEVAFWTAFTGILGENIREDIAWDSLATFSGNVFFFFFYAIFITVFCN